MCGVFSVQQHRDKVWPKGVHGTMCCRGAAQPVPFTSTGLVPLFFSMDVQISTFRTNKRNSPIRSEDDSCIVLSQA